VTGTIQAESFLGRIPIRLQPCCHRIRTERWAGCFTWVGVRPFVPARPMYDPPGLLARIPAAVIAGQSAPPAVAATHFATFGRRRTGLPKNGSAYTFGYSSCFACANYHFVVSTGGIASAESSIERFAGT
jgi:hypothetical protein